MRRPATFICIIIEVTQAVVVHAGDFADTFALRGYDSVQRAAAYEAKQISGPPLTFACFDSRLNKAAGVLGMRTPFVIAFDLWRTLWVYLPRTRNVRRVTTVVSRRLTSHHQ